ncbi:MAG: hypothetical protein F4Y58_00210 [Gammaproteobacteria bacterium]|nr:hypothetical protein [Gammaproteobacteria bacterium]
MTATKRCLAVFFAIVCVLVLVGGSLKASAFTGVLWNPIIEFVHGIKFSNGERQLHIKFRILALMAEDLPMEVCARLEHRVGSGGFGVNKCGPDQFSSEGSGKYKVVFNVPSQSQWGPIKKTSISIKAKIQRKDGTVWETDYAQSSEFINW